MDLILNTIDYKRLRESLEDYYGTAIVGGFPLAMMDLSKVENASKEELINMAKEIGLNLRKYVIN